MTKGFKTLIINNSKIKQRPKQTQKTRGPSNGMSKLNPRPTNAFRQMSVCEFAAEERVATVVVPITSSPGDLLYSALVSPTVPPRLSTLTSQFSSWRGEMWMRVESTGNAFSSNYVALKYFNNSDFARVPTDPSTLLSFAEASDRANSTARLQLDSNKVSEVNAPWALSANKTKLILDTDPSDCNNGQFLIVSNGSPGTTAVTLTVRIRYRIRLIEAIVAPFLLNSSKLFTGVAPLTATNFIGTTPISIGPGVLSATANTVTFPAPGSYIVTSYAVGTGLTAATGTITGGTFLAPSYTNVSSGTVSMGTWNVTTTATNAIFSITQPATTITASNFQINPLKF
jgi:hypothetical protein